VVTGEKEVMRVLSFETRKYLKAEVDRRRRERLLGSERAYRSLMNEIQRAVRLKDEDRLREAA